MRSLYLNALGLTKIPLSVMLLLFGSTPCGASFILTPETIVTALQRHALNNSSWKAENVEVRVLSYQPVSLHSLVTLRILRPSNGVTPGPQSFFIAAESDGKDQARFWVKAEVRVFEEVVVSSRSLVLNEIVTATDVRLERRDVSLLNARPFYRIDDVVGHQVLRAISVNETLTQKSLDRPILMRRGNAVMLVYETGVLRVETPGTAEENGRAGELIQVKNPVSGRVLRGRVLDDRTVRVDR